jgi:hypothetical protein
MLGRILRTPREPQFIGDGRKWGCMKALLGIRKSAWSSLGRSRKSVKQRSRSPHIVIDDFLPTEVETGALSEFSRKNNLYWTTKRAKASVKQAGRAVDNQLQLRSFSWVLNAAPFVLFPPELTGSLGLLPDPYQDGGGIPQAPNGGFLNIQEDFNKHTLTKTDRCLNALLCVNEDWLPEYGVNLELWSTDMARCVRLVPPIAGRMVVFSTTDWSYQGHPDPLTCPLGRTGKSIALYYYTLGRPVDEASPPYSTMYKLRPGGT